MSGVDIADQRADAADHAQSEPRQGPKDNQQAQHRDERRRRAWVPPPGQPIEHRIEGDDENGAP